jgi:hypothetical protein
MTYYTIGFEADGIEPEDTGKVKIIISTTDPSIPQGEVNLYTVPNSTYPLRVTFVPTELAPGDTAVIILEKRYDEYPYFTPEDVTYEPFPSLQLFNVEIEKGKEYGTILRASSSDTSDEFTDIEQGFRFIAKYSINTDTVKIRVSTVIDNSGGGSSSALTGKGTKTKVGEKEDIVKFFPKIKTNKNGKIQKSNGVEEEKVPINSMAGASPLSLYEEIFGLGKVVIEAEHTILLGESKYYQTKYNTQKGKLKIEEIKPDANGVPQQKTGTENGWQWITSDTVWGSNPVSVVECDTCGKKMGVYWEKKYPTNQFENVLIIRNRKTRYYNIIKMDSLETGLIRLVGRYWDADSTYSATLKAKRDNGDSSEIRIRVVKPSMLNSPGQISSFKYLIDVFYHLINIDSLCILYGGRYGIPPQFIKGQMYTESVKTYYSTLSDSGFAPSYRFEPFTTQYEPQYKTDTRYNSYFIYDSTYTFSDVPTHNVKYINYPTDINTVWDMIEKYSKLVSPNPNINYYGGRNSNTHRVWLGYEVVDSDYTEFAKAFKKKYPNLTEVQKYDSTNKKMIDYLKYDWTRNGAPRGTKNNIAQTRVASSYGLAQFLYGTARDIGYPNEDVPENINLMSYAYLFYKTQKSYLQQGLGVSVESNNNWSDGYEYSFCRRIYVPRWNSDIEYAKDVISNSKRFFPH